jgi:hypothetical protein
MSTLAPLARTQPRYDELLAVVNGERSRMFFTKGAWLNRKTGEKLTGAQSRTLTALQKAGLIMIKRERPVTGPLIAVRTEAGWAALGEWTQPKANRPRR